MATNLTKDDLKIGRVFRGKKPKIVGDFERLVDDREILWISKSKIPYKVAGKYALSDNYIKWCKDNIWRNPHSEGTMLQYELYCDNHNLPIDTLLTDYTVQYNSPTVTFGKKYPTIRLEVFLKWADKDITDTLEKGEWAKTF